MQQKIQNKEIKKDRMNFAVLFYVEWGGGGKRGRRPVLTLLREEKVAAEPTDELHFFEL